ncbi:DDE-type integrase/transposase/recombinase [Kutzneria sp. CA-103260]|uniref:DDE-type integrase/transposase/recombinase n=1 Tax=Kutzneria sp. CA-103260 TaxID=2802641 RepID=UPI001BA997F6
MVLDVHSRCVVGWSIDSSPTAALVTNALGMAIDSRRPGRGAIIHSDHGVQFGSWAFTKRATDSGFVPSMGSGLAAAALATVINLAISGPTRWSWVLAAALLAVLTIGLSMWGLAPYFSFRRSCSFTKRAACA